VARALNAESSLYVRAYFFRALLLGTRKRELLQIRGSDIDAERWTVRLANTKNGRPHELPLARQAQEILNALPRERGNSHVFPGRFEGESLSVPTIDQAWRRVRIAAGVPDVRLHDLRRTLGSWVVQQAGSLALVGALLNHSDPRVTAEHYARFADAHRRTALDAPGDAVMNAAGVQHVRALLHGVRDDGLREAPNGAHSADGFSTPWVAVRAHDHVRGHTGARAIEE